MKHASITTLVAILLMAVGSTVEADDGPTPASANVSQPAQHAIGKPSTNRDLQRATPMPSRAARRNALNVNRVADAGTVPSRTARSTDGQRWKWSANQVPEALVTPL